VSPLPLLLSLALGGALVVVLVLAIRRGIREQAELDELSDLVEYEEADEDESPAIREGWAIQRVNWPNANSKHFSGPTVTERPSQQNKPIEASASRSADSLSLSSK